MLIGGLGLGYALDAALAERRVERVTVAEYEPLIVDWFRAYGEGRAERLAAGEAAGRARVVVADVADVMRESPGASTSSLSTPTTVPTGSCARPTPASTTRPASRSRTPPCAPAASPSSGRPSATTGSRPGSPRVFARVDEVRAHDHIGRHRHEYTMYVAGRGVD